MAAMPALCVQSRTITNVRAGFRLCSQQVSLSLSSPSSPKVRHRLWHIDRPLSRSASDFNTATSQHVNSSTAYTSHLLCPKVTAISPLWTTQIRWQTRPASWYTKTVSEGRVAAGLFDPAALFTIRAQELNSICVWMCVIKALRSGAMGAHQSNVCVQLQQTGGFTSQRCTISDLS